MKPIPSEVSARWSPMWPKDCHPDRPWWCLHEMTYRRCDGITLRLAATMRLVSDPDERGLWGDAELFDDAMARIDAAHPLPVPPPMCGQVWSVGGDEVLITFSEGNAAAWRYAFMGGPIVNGGTSYTQGGKPWPMDEDAFLVAGPTPWGRDVPWSPA